MAAPRTLSTPLAACLLVACSPAPPPPPVVKVSPPPVVSAAPAEASAADPVVPELAAWKPPQRSADTAACKKIEAEQGAASEKSVDVPEGSLSSGGDASTPCLPGRGGAWGLIGTVVDWEKMPPISLGTAYCEENGQCVLNPVIRFVPVYVSDSGAVKRGAPIVTTVFAGGIGDNELGAFDLDGDGVEELIFTAGDGAILTFKDDKISPYPGAKGLALARIVDFDQDGRPDLVLRNPYVGSFLSCGFEGGLPILDFGAELLVVARSLPDGSFSTADPAAQAITKQQCPAIPRRIVVKGEGGAIDNIKLRQNIACARAWGVAAQAVEKVLETDCVWVPEGEDECEHLFAIRAGRPVTRCAGKDVLLGWSSAPAPVTLR